MAATDAAVGACSGGRAGVELGNGDARGRGEMGDVGSVGSPCETESVPLPPQRREGGGDVGESGGAMA